MVEEMKTLLTYLPLSVAGRTLRMALMKVLAFSAIFSAVERGLGDAGIDDAGLVDAELHPAFLDLGHGIADIEGHRARFRAGHQALGAQRLAELADALHHVGRGDDHVIFEPVLFLDLFDDLVAAHEVGTGLGRFLLLLAGGDDQHPLDLARAEGQDDGAAHHLLGVLGVDRQAHGHVHRFVELGGLDLLEQGHGLVDDVGALRYFFLGLDVCFSAFGHYFISRPRLRAEPSMILIACCRSLVFRSSILALAMSSTCFLVTLPTLFLLGSPEPFRTPAAFFRK